MNTKQSIFVIALMVVFTFSTQPANAQPTAKTTGTVVDSSGAVIPGAQITVVNEDTGIRWKTVTNEAGNYSVPLLQPGSYRINVQAEGFRAVSRSGIRLEVAQTAKVDFELKVGVVAESIDVRDTAPLLDTGSNAIGGLVTRDRIENLPMKGRNSSSLMMLVPGVRMTRATTDQPALESHYQFFSINGSRPNQSQFMLDGSNNSNLAFNGPEYSAQVDAVLEFRVQTSNFSAEYANSAGGVINVVTKSGTNELHGSASEYFRNDALAANNFFSNQSGTKKAALRYNQFGGTLGGPIKKNRTFFFGGFEGLRMILPIFTTTSVPTTLQRAGDFSQTLSSTGQMIVVYDPLSTLPDPAKAGAYIRTPFASNRIPQDRINPVSVKMQSYYPAATSSGNPYTGLNNFFFSGPQLRNTNDYNGRADHQLNATTMITGRYARFNVNPWQNPATFGESNVASPGYTTKPQHHINALFRLTKTFSPTLFGEFSSSWTRWSYESLPLSMGFDPTKLGFPSDLVANSRGLGFPLVSPGEMSGLGSYAYAHHVSDRAEFKANLSKILGKHTLKFGGLYALGKFKTMRDMYSVGTYSFTKAFTQGPDPTRSSTTAGFGYATFLLGTLSSGSHNPSQLYAILDQPYAGLYLQDEYKVTSRLTLNVGVRWDYESPRTEKNNQVTNFDFSNQATLQNGTTVRGGLMFPGVNGVSRGHWNAEKAHFAPRLGFAYNLGKNNDTVIRAGFGIFYANSWGNGSNSDAIPQTGFTCSTSATSSLDGGLTPYAYLSNPFPEGLCKAPGSAAGLLANLGESINMIDRNQMLPYMESWNFDIQRKLPGDMVVEVAYSGSRGIHLMGVLEYNQLDPQYMTLGTQLNSKVTNPYYGVIKTGSLSQPTITLGQSLRPYPQFLGVSSRAATYGASTYHAMFLRMERRFSKGFSVLGSYTVSKVLDDIATGFPGESFVSSDVRNYYNRRGERALAAWDTPQTLVISYGYELPFGPGKPWMNWRGAAGKILGGWEIHGITTFMSGPPLPVSGGNSTGAFAGAARPNWSGVNPSKSGAIQDRLGQYFDTTVFSLNDPYTFGNAPRMMPNLRGPGQNNFDLSVFKSTQLNERFKLQFRAEAFNAFNRVQFGNPNTSVTSNSFGRISSQQNSPRDIQLVLKLLF